MHGYGCAWNRLLCKHYDTLVSPIGSVSVLPVPALIAGHQLALQWCLDFLTADFAQRQQQQQQQQREASAAQGGYSAPAHSEVQRLPHPVSSIQLSNLPALLAVIRSQLASKQPLLQLSDADRHYLSVLVLQAFLQGLQRPGARGSGGTGFASNIRVHELPVGGEGGVQRSSLFDGVVLDIPLPIHRRIEALCAPTAPSAGSTSSMSALHAYGPLRVILYDINLTFAESEHFSADVGIGIRSSGADDTTDRAATAPARDDYQQHVYGLMRSLCLRWQSVGVTLLACQKVIHPYLQQLCLERGILPLERLSIRHMEAVRQAAGGQVLSAIDEQQVQPQRVGALARLEEKIINRRRFVFLTPAAAAATTPGKPSSSAPPMIPAAGVTTFLLAASSAAQQSELSALLPRIFRILTHLLRTPLVCAGAGATEMQLAAHIRRMVDEQRRAAQCASPTIEIGNASDPVASSAAEELAALDLRLRGAHVRQLQRGAEHLSAAALQVADVLEDIACFGAWRSSSTRPQQQHSAHTDCLLDELKAHMRDLHASSTTSAPSSQQKDAAILRSHMSKQPSAAAAAMTSAAPSVPAAAAGNDAAVSAMAPASLLPAPWLLSADAPEPEPNWKLRDWKLQYEATHGTSSHAAGAPAAAVLHIAREAGALYGFSLQRAEPAVVWRADATSALLHIDQQTVLDPLYAKKAALQVAIEAAGVLLRVDQIVRPQV